MQSICVWKETQHQMRCRIQGRKKVTRLLLCAQYFAKFHYWSIDVACAMWACCNASHTCLTAVALALHKKLLQGVYTHIRALLIRHIARSNEVVLQHGVDKPPIGDACLPLHKWLIEVVQDGGEVEGAAHETRPQTATYSILPAKKNIENEREKLAKW